LPIHIDCNGIVAEEYFARWWLPNYLSLPKLPLAATDVDTREVGGLVAVYAVSLSYNVVLLSVSNKETVALSAEVEL